MGIPGPSTEERRGADVAYEGRRPELGPSVPLATARRVTIAGDVPAASADPRVASLGGLGLRTHVPTVATVLATAPAIEDEERATAYGPRREAVGTAGAA